MEQRGGGGTRRMRGGKRDKKEESEGGMSGGGGGGIIEGSQYFFNAGEKTFCNNLSGAPRNSILSRRGDLTYCFLSYCKIFSHSILIDAHSMLESLTHDH